ncbi:hypothetical protein HBH98_204640 [Parastagonospora nodorum]|nr:hypothetical protein HBH51_186170 [Parastagonospora nodorum]KAH4159289.1 hypothetical protein HBH43_189620 [Parastagonospora nodorum]KAH4191544.1 hypothetical protein HBI95_211320 [Parastagonospora nodorum]KAH4253323.1 hypothetical protein HBI03_195910 [Parastagonospora nodorum]KAH4264954.1 hypothetical protein HBI04_185490 [Parastagonospora nodorum]
MTKLSMKLTPFPISRKRYATQSWSAHFREATKGSSDPAYLNYLEVFEKLGQRTTSFLSEKTQFTSWTEALGHLGCPQEAWVIESVGWESLQHFSAKSPVQSAVSLLHLAFQEHTKLVEYWSNVLKKYPEELWQPSISAFSESKLRKTSTAARTSSVPSNIAHDQNSVVLQTKCSSSGRAIGVLHAQYRSE